MYLRKAQAGGAPGHTWEEDGQVIEVDDELAASLLAIPNGGFSEAAPPVTPEPEPEPEEPEEPEPEPEEANEAEEEQDGEAEATEEAPPKKKGGRPRLPRDESGKIIRTEISE